MSGTQLFLRRSASILAASSALAVVSCGVEFNGLFEDDASTDGAARTEAGYDANSSGDRTSDTRLDAVTDGAAADTSSDVSGPDTSFDVDTTSDASRDPSVGADVAGDTDVNADAKNDASRDVARDVDNDARDAVAEDTAGDPRVDAPIESGIDVIADTSADISPDRIDAGPPGTCSGACSTFDNIGQTITRTVDMGPPPPMTGGTLVDGTYVATAIVHYNGDMSAYSLSETSIISGTMDAWVSSVNGAAETRVTTTFTAANNQITFAICCPTSSSLTISYTTDGTTLRHIDPANMNRVVTYTRQ